MENKFGLRQHVSPGQIRCTKCFHLFPRMADIGPVEEMSWECGGCSPTIPLPAPGELRYRLAVGTEFSDTPRGEKEIIVAADERLIKCTGPCGREFLHKLPTPVSHANWVCNECLQMPPQLRPTDAAARIPAAHEPQPNSLEYLKNNDAVRLQFRGTKVYIWSGEHEAYWRKYGKGYTSDGLLAGVYDFETAWCHTNHCGPEKRISFRVVGADRKPMPDLHVPGVASETPPAVREVVIDGVRFVPANSQPVSDETIRGMLTRLQREHDALRADWENETGKPWVSPYDTEHGES